VIVLEAPAEFSIEINPLRASNCGFSGSILSADRFGNRQKNFCDGGPMHRSRAKKIRDLVSVILELRSLTDSREANLAQSRNADVKFGLCHSFAQRNYL
jgi:hypothetical protein